MPGRVQGVLSRRVPVAVGSAVIVAAAYLVGVGGEDRLRWAMVAALVAGAVSLLDTKPLAVLAGAAQVVEVLDAVPSDTLLFLRLLPAGALAARCALDVLADSDLRRRPWRAFPAPVLVLAGLLVSIALVRALFGVGRAGLPSSFNYLVVSATLVAVVVVGVGRLPTVWSIATGHLVGMTASAVVSLCQASGRWSPRELLHDNARYPGLSIEAPQLSWKLATALLVAVTLWARGNRWQRGAAAVAGLICAAALVACGAQGGLAALAVVGVALATVAWRRGEIQRLAPTRVAEAGVVVLICLALAHLSGVGLGSLDGLSGDREKGYANEVARFDGFRFGLESFRDRPLAGPGRDHYDETFEVPPHVYPLYVAVTAGVVGLVIAGAAVGLVAVLAWRSVRRRTGPYLWPGISGVLLIEAFLTPAGSFEQPSRTVLLFATVAALSATGPTGDDEPGSVLEPANGTRAR